MNFWTADTIRDATQGRWLSRPRTERGIERLTTDSRDAGPMAAFVALKGETTDGHLHVLQAAEAGAPVVVIHTEAAATVAVRELTAVLLVGDTGAALLRLAAAYRRHLEGTRVIAVGGSNGKTTTVRLIDSVLSTELRGSASKKSFNNAVGVPLTILSAKKGDQYLICEVGTNAPGEIAPLIDVIRPDVAVLTSIGREHLEGLGSLDGVIREEVTVLSGLKPGGLAVLPADTPELRPAVRRLGTNGMKTIWFGTAADADLRVSDARTTLSGTTFTLNGREELRIPLFGVHNATNAAAAVAVARRLGIGEASIARGLAGAEGPPMRMQRAVLDGPDGPITFINDAYNANPDSMMRSFETFFVMAAAAAAERVVLVLGDMLELGTHGPLLHLEVVRAAREHLSTLKSPWLLVLVGPLMMKAGEDLPDENTHAVESLRGEQAALAAAWLKAGDLVLLKGSRGTGVERIFEACGLANRDGLKAGLRERSDERRVE